MSLFLDEELPQPVELPVASNPFASSMASNDPSGESTPVEPMDAENFPFDKLSTPLQDARCDAVTFNVPQTVTRRPLAEALVELSPETTNEDVIAPVPNGVVDDDDPAREFLERERDFFSTFNDEESTESLTSSNGPSVSSGLESGPSFETASPITPITPSTVVRVVPEAVIAAEAKMKERIALKDAEEERQIAQLREEARRELEEFYAKYRERVGKTKAANREAQEAFVEGLDRAADDGKRWEKVGSLCDFSGKGIRGSKDVTRMRSILMQLKQKSLVVNGQHS